MAHAALKMTKREEAAMQEVMAVYKAREEDHKVKNHGTTTPSFTLVLNTKTNPGATLYEINLEVIVRQAANFRATNAFRNRLLAWNAALRGNGMDGTGHTGSQSSVMRLWLEGIAAYYMQAIGTGLTKLGATFSDVHDSDNRATDGALPMTATWCSSHQESISDASLNAVIASAQQSVTTELCENPAFLSVLRLMPEFLRAFTVANALVRSFSDEVSSANVPVAASPPAGSFLTTFETLLKSGKRSRDWYFSLFVVMIGALRLHYLQAISTSSNSGLRSGGSAALTDELRSVLAAASNLLRKTARDHSSASDIISATTLRYARAACTLSYPPDQLVAQVNAMQANDVTTSASREVAPALTAAEYRSQPLFHAVTKGIPDLLAKMEDFMASNSIERAWVTTVVLTHLYRFAPTRSRKVVIGSVTAEAVDLVGKSSRHMREYECSAEVKPRDSFLFQLLVVYLRPLLRQLLVCQPPDGDGDEESSSGSVAKRGAAAGAAIHGGSAGGELESGTVGSKGFVLTDSQKEAHEALQELVSAVELITMPSATRMRRWSLLGMGDQDIGGCAFGPDCLKEAIGDVLGEIMRDMLVWTTKPRAQWKAVLTTNDAQRVVTDDEMLMFYNYLIKTEKFYHELTSVSSSGRGAGATATATANAPRGPDANRDIAIAALHRHKAQYYRAVSDALQTIYPANASFALIIPTVNATHAYLLRMAESQGTGAPPGSGPGAAPTRIAPKAPPGIKGVKKMPPPGAAGNAKGAPSAAGSTTAAATARVQRLVNLVPELNSEADFHAALRIVDCIKSRDQFFIKYQEMLRVRLTFRPPPQRIRDEIFDTTKRQLERDACEYLAAVTAESADLKSMRAMIDNFKPDYYTSKDVSSSAVPKLVVNVLDWRYWSIESDEKYLFKDAVATNMAPHLVNMDAAGMPTQSEPLPFPRDLWAAMTEYQRGYQASHKGKVLRWFAPDVSQATFTVAYPKDEGRLTTIHGTLLMEQLFLAIAQYRRVGVSWATLAHRGRVSVESVRKLFARPLERDRLLVIVTNNEVPAGSPEERVALNYDFTRPPQSRNGEFSYWLGCKQKADSIDADSQRAVLDRRMMAAQTATIQVMKGGRKLPHQALFAAVRERVASHFQLTSYMFKKVIDQLVESAFIERDSENDDIYNYRS